MEMMTTKIILIFVALLGLADTWMLKISPSDIYLTKNATLEAQCEINKASNIPSSDIKFRFRLDKQFGPVGYNHNYNGHFEYEVSNKYIKVHNDSLVSIKHDVYSPKFANSVLECYVNEYIFAKSMVNLGDFPHNATGASCFVKNWKNISCEIATSGTHEIFTTNWNYCLSDEIRSVEIKGTLQSGNSLVQENIFSHFKINDTLIMEVFASNILGVGHKSHFEFPLMDLVVPDPGYLDFNSSSNNYVILLSLVLPKPDESFVISVEVNCSNMPSRYKVEMISNASESGGRILINLTEEHLPASQNCSVFTRLKPLHYGKFSDESNKVMFRTRDRVPLKNPDIFNSSLEVRKCNGTICDVDIYFKPLNVEEARGHVMEYRVKLVGNGKVIRETVHANNGAPFISIEKMSLEHMREFLVSIEAATEAGYNNTINAQLMKLNASVDNYKHLPSEFLNKSKVSSKPLLLPMHLVVLNDSRADIVYHLDDDSENICIVWCLYDESNQRCRKDFNWKQLIEIKGVMEFNVPPGNKISEYNFGLQIGSGLQWLKFPCLFTATPESKPAVPFFHDIIRNMSHIVLYVSLPKCSETEAINFPGGYLVEWFDLRKNDNIMNRTYHYLDNPIVIDGLHTGIFNVSVRALPWKQGTCSERFYFQHTSVDEDSSKLIACICVIFGGVMIICGACLIKKLWPQKLLKIDVPKNKQYEIHETVRGYSNFTSNISTSGYKACTNRDVEEINSIDGSPNNNGDDLKLWDSSCFKRNDIGMDIKECYLNFVDSGHSYAVTKLLGHPICLKEKLLNLPAKSIQVGQVGSLEVLQEIVGDQMEEKFQHDEIMGSGKVESNSSCESSLPDYPSIKLIRTSTPVGLFIKQENIFDKITSTNCCKSIETDDFKNVDDCLSSHVADSGESSDGYCDKSVFKHLPIFNQFLSL